MIRTEIRLTEEQSRRLHELARSRGISLAEAIRQCVDTALQRETMDRRALYARMWEVVGKFPDREGARDLSRHHDRYTEGAFGS